MTDQERIAQLRAENAELRELVREVPALREQLAAALAQIRELQAQLAKDSPNSRKPPSSDGLKRPPPLTRSLRRANGKKRGGQLGHAGETLHLVAEPDVVVEHRPAVCATCQKALGETAEVVAQDRRQVQELPVVRLEVTEHRALHLRCPSCQQVSVGPFPPEAPSRVQYGPRLRGLAVYLLDQHLLPYERTGELLADVYGAHVLEGTLAAWVQQGAETLGPVEEAIKAALVRAPVLHLLHHDETCKRYSNIGRSML